PPTHISILPLHDALPIWPQGVPADEVRPRRPGPHEGPEVLVPGPRTVKLVATDRAEAVVRKVVDTGREDLVMILGDGCCDSTAPDRKSTRLNSSHRTISY